MPLLRMTAKAASGTISLAVEAPAGTKPEELDKIARREVGRMGNRWEVYGWTKEKHTTTTVVRVYHYGDIRDPIEQARDRDRMLHESS